MKNEKGDASLLKRKLVISFIPYGSGHSIDTSWAVYSAMQATGQTISYAGQAISRTASTVSQSALNAMSATISRISSIINSLKYK